MNESFCIVVLGISALFAGSAKVGTAQMHRFNLSDAIGYPPFRGEAHLSNEVDTQQASAIRDVLVPDDKRQLARLSKKLDLRANQGTWVRAILAERDRQIQMIQSSEGLPNDAKAARITAIVADSNLLIEKNLNGKQKRKFEQLLARQLERELKNRGPNSADNLPTFPPTGTPRFGVASRLA